MKFSAVLATAFLSMLPAAAETLHYSVNWPSGLSLGEASIRSTHTGEGRTEGGPEPGWEFELTLDAAIPGFSMRDHYTSSADSGFCSIQLEKMVTRGDRKSEERDKFDQRAQEVTRETQVDGGGKSTYSVPACARDAMTFLQFVRSELAQGRLAPHQPVVLGAKYDLQLTYVGMEEVRIADERQQADKVRVDVKGPKSRISLELFFAHDDVRTPLKATLPLPLGAFTVELIP